MRREDSPQPKGGNGRYFGIFIVCVVLFVIVENVIPKGLHTAPLVFLIFVAAAAAMYVMLKKNYTRCEFVLAENEFYITTAIGHKEHIVIALPLEKIKKLYPKDALPSGEGVKTETFGAEGEGYSAILYEDETAGCDKIAKFSVSDEFFRDFSEKLLDIGGNV